MGDSLSGRLLAYDSLEQSFRTFKLRRDPECPTCSIDPERIVIAEYDELCMPAPARPAARGLIVVARPNVSPIRLLTARIRDKFEGPLRRGSMSAMRGLLARASTVVGLGLAIVAIAFAGAVHRPRLGRGERHPGRRTPGWIVAAFLVAAAAMTAIAIPWRHVLRMLGGDLSWPETVARYYAGEIGKYLPGGVWPVLGRGELARRAGVARTAAYSSVALSLALLYLAAMFVVLVCVPVMIAAGGSLASLWVLALLPLGLAGLHHAVLERVRGMASSG